MALATLSIDIEARLAKLEQDLGRGVQTVDKHVSQMAAAFDRVKLAGAAVGASLASGLSVSAIMDFVQRTTDAAEQIARLSELAGSNTTEFQKYAAGAKSAGVDMEKFASIMKDTQDKLGDFFVSGGGELQDFFEKIAPKVKITADQFRNLSGPEALQLFYSSLEKANVGQKVLINQMEAIADDAALLIPLLRNNGAGFADMAAQAEKAGTIMSEKTVKEAVELSKQLKELQSNVDGLSNSIASTLVPQLNNLFKDFKKDGFGGGILSMLGFGEMEMGRARSKAEEATYALAQQQNLVALMQENVDADPGNDRLQKKLKRLQDRLVTLQTEALKAANAFRILVEGDEPTKEEKTPEPAKTQNQLKIPQDKKPPTDAERYLEKLRGESDKLLNLNTYDQSLLDMGRNMEGLTPALKKRILALADENDKKQEALFFTEKLAAAEERWSKDFVGPELPPDVAANLERLNELMRNTPTAKLQEARKDMLLLADAFTAGTFGAEGSQEAIDRFAEVVQTRLGTLPDEVQKLDSLFDDLKSSIEGWGQDAAAAMVDFAITGKTSFGDMANSIMADMAKMATYRLITQPLFNAIGSMLPSVSFGGMGGGGEVAGPGLRMANGGAWDAGVQKFANGGAFTNSIVDSPTLFKFAQGTGLMGEAGPEAIMPLRRGPDGRLGVSAAGAGAGPSFKVEIKNYSGAPVHQRSVPDGRGGRRVEVVIGELAAAEIERSGSRLNSSARRAYGLAPALVGR